MRLSVAATKELVRPRNESARPERQLRTGYTHREETSMSTGSIPDWETSATTADLEWWWAKAPTLRWTWATTFADFAPHWYVVLGRTHGMEFADYARVGRVIRTFGEPGKFYSKTNLYLYTPDRIRKVWAMWQDPPVEDDPTLINLAFTDRTFGRQADFDEQRLSMLRLEERL